jgi:hypothetical protein
MVKIMEKNYFAALDFRTGAAIGGGIVATLLMLITAAGPFSGIWTGWATSVAWYLMAVPAWICARRLGWRPGAALITPLIYPLLLYAVLNSVVVTLRQGGVRWRETFYPLEQLRARGVTARGTRVK